MIRKSLIALSTAAVLATGMSAAASAKTNLNIDVGLGFGGGGIYLGGGYPVYPAYPGYPVYYGDYGPGCGMQWVPWKKVWNASHTHKVWKYKKVWVCN
jgi:hypothetical protein